MLFVRTRSWWLLLLLIDSNLIGPTLAEDTIEISSNRFEYELGVLQKFANLDGTVKDLVESYRTISSIIENLSRDMTSARLSANGNTYIRWGRNKCPAGATLVYTGYVAGSDHRHKGSGANKLCMIDKPSWNEYTPELSPGGNQLFGTEYHIFGFTPFEHLLNHDVPCSVCRIPRSDVLMIPGTNQCPANYRLEYDGYIMSGFHTHPAPSEFICVDSHPEITMSGYRDDEQSFLYMVQAVCGSLPCPPYVQGREITCAVCSYSFNTTMALFNADG